MVLHALCVASLEANRDLSFPADGHRLVDRGLETFDDSFASKGSFLFLADFYGAETNLRISILLLGVDEESLSSVHLHLIWLH